MELFGRHIADDFHLLDGVFVLVQERIVYHNFKPVEEAAGGLFVVFVFGGDFFEFSDEFFDVRVEVVVLLLRNRFEIAFQEKLNVILVNMFDKHRVAENVVLERFDYDTCVDLRDVAHCFH